MVTRGLWARQCVRYDRERRGPLGAAWPACLLFGYRDNRGTVAMHILVIDPRQALYRVAEPVIELGLAMDRLRRSAGGDRRRHH